MVLGLFFSEVGTRLLGYLAEFDPQLNAIKEDLIVSGNWSEQKFSSVAKRLKAYDYKVDIRRGNLEDLRRAIEVKSDFLLRLLENPVLLEHEAFTELLRALFHLREEFLNRPDFYRLPDTDYDHLAGDIKRVYAQLVHQWLDYMKYLKDNYPYLFSLAMRTNPFDPAASPIVR